LHFRQLHRHLALRLREVNVAELLRGKKRKEKKRNGPIIQKLNGMQEVDVIPFIQLTCRLLPTRLAPTLAVLRSDWRAIPDRPNRRGTHVSRCNRQLVQASHIALRDVTISMNVIHAMRCRQTSPTRPRALVRPTYN
jgi:hypothetical protein